MLIFQASNLCLIHNLYSHTKRKPKPKEHTKKTTKQKRPGTVKFRRLGRARPRTVSPWHRWPSAQVQTKLSEYCYFWCTGKLKCLRAITKAMNHQKPFSLKEFQAEETEGEITLEQCYCSKARQAGQRATAEPIPVPICPRFFLRP